MIRYPVGPAEKLMKGRFDALDGLRGAACLVVVVFHLLSAFVPSAVPPGSPSIFWWADSPLAFLYNGYFSVSVFFVLSGFVLAHTSRRYRDQFAVDLFVRYLRLALPATASVVLAWGLLTAYPMAAQELGRHAPSPLLKWTYQGQIPSLWNALMNGLVGEFYPGGSLFNGVLWTMRLELIGSFGVYFFFQWTPKQRHFLLGSLALAALILLRASSAYVGFALGALLYVQYSGGKTIRAPVALGLFVVGLVAGSQAGFETPRWLAFLPNALKPGNRFGLVHPLAAAMVVAGVLFTPGIRRFFSMQAFRFLGYISFPLYLIHMPFILTVCAAYAVAFNAITGVRLLMLCMAALALLIQVAYLFERVIDQPVLGLNGWLKTSLARGRRSAQSDFEGT